MITEEQRQFRKKGIGGSDIAAIMGLSRYKTPLDVYNDKMGLSEDIQSNRFEIGNRLEPLIKELYEKELYKKETNILVCEGFPIIAEKKCLGDFTHLPSDFINANAPKLIANVDAIVSATNDAPGYIVEFKTALRKDDWHEIPVEYKYQVAWYCEIAGVARADIAVLFLDGEFRIYTYEHDSKFGKSLIDFAEKWWASHIVAKKSPLPSTIEELNKVYSQSEYEIIASNDEINRLHTRLSQAKELIKIYENQEMEIRQELMQYMKEKDALVDYENGNIMATWRTQKRNFVDVMRLKDKYPQIHKELLKETSVRTFLLKK